MVKFNLYFDSNVVESSELVRIGIDQQCLAETQLPLDHVEFWHSLDLGAHTLWIELCGKDPKNEQRINGELINDTYFKVSNLAINNSMMNHLLNDHAYVIPDWNHHQDVAQWFKENRGAVPDRLENSNYVNLKGCYYFQFELPIRDYLDKSLATHPTYAHLYNAPMGRYRSLKEKLLK